MFAEVEARGLVAPGTGEQETSDRIRDLSNEMFGTATHRHRRLVRSGPRTLFPYEASRPPDRITDNDDVPVITFGPVFEAYEVDFIRTLVFGDAPAKHHLRGDLATVFAAGRNAFRADPAITGRQLYAEVARRAADAGWALGGRHAGHLVGAPPYESIDGAGAGVCVDSYITPDNGLPLRRVDHVGWRCHWILEIHLTDGQHGFGGLYEQLLDLA
ncbi:M24 family metallopeptidase [Streptomyces sp. NPDC056944]|uniref:M24 family metallopeptidase n=1 Tax=Streptomyces sp. NPDC056944 TaxID=3345972 RepID=UPI003632657D